jgi:RNA polymerase sigma-70 factor (ECF subfamily)
MIAKRSNEEWLADLKSSGEAKAAALSDLRAILIKSLPYALSTWLSPTDPQFEPLVEEVVQETLIRVMENLDSFEGRSQFTTWVNKIAVRLALTELRRRRWRDFSLDVLSEDREEGVSIPSLLWDPAPDPDRLSEQSDILRRVRQIIAEELTEKQRQAMIGVAVRGAPLEEVARRMGMNRNALYKLLHDARLNLKRRLANEGLEVDEIYATFGNQ